MTRMSIDARRAQLVDAAMAIAVREGVEAVTVRRVAANAGVSLGIVHYCFEDKVELLRSMGDMLPLVATEPVRRALEGSTDIRVVAHATADGLWEALIPRRHMHLLAFEFATAGVRSRALRPIAEMHQQQTWAATRGVLEEVARVCGVTFSGDIDFLARLVAGYIHGIELAWLIGQDDNEAITSFHALADYVLTFVVEPESVFTSSDRVEPEPIVAV